MDILIISIILHLEIYHYSYLSILYLNFSIYKQESI